MQIQELELRASQQNVSNDDDNNDEAAEQSSPVKGSSINGGAEREMTQTELNRMRRHAANEKKR